MDTRPEVDRLVLYKHGVAFVGRRGPLRGGFTLTFRQEDMKDVLKSLTINAAADGVTMGAVSFDTPADPHAELADRNLLLQPGAALAGLIDALRGRSVEVDCGDQIHRGLVIGYDDGAEPGAQRLLVLRTDSGEITLVDLSAARRFALLEPVSQDDMDYLVDRSRVVTAGRNCDVTVRIGGAADDVRVSYLVAAAMWRVSYRLIRDESTATLIATAIIHNPVDEDLVDVEVTLTTGQPISFDIDLYHGRQVQRAVVEESERVAAPRRAYAAPTSLNATAPMADAAGVAGVYEGAAAQVETSDRGEYFEYRLADLVSLKRGGAAMVPLTVAPVDGARRELVWRAERGIAPDVVLAFPNNTGVVLEEGPVVVYEMGSYSGEAMLGFTSRGSEVRLAFAKDLAVRCRSNATTQNVTTHLRLTANTLIEEQRCERRHTLRAENDHDDPIEVVFEIPVSPDHTVVVGAGAVDAGRDGAWCRFTVAVPERGSAQATVLETWPIASEIAYDELDPGRLEAWLADRALDAETVAALSQVLAHRNTARALAEQGARVQTQREDAYAAQSRITEGLQVLGTDGAEGELRARQVRELDALHERVALLDGELNRLRQEADAAEQRAAASLRQVLASP